jgi:hypothetical protein
MRRSKIPMTCRIVVVVFLNAYNYGMGLSIPF